MTTRWRSLIAGALATLGLMASAGAASALADPPGGWPFEHQGPGSAVFVETDGLAGNQIVAYDRRGDGTLAPAGTYSTGGRGGQLTGSVVDHTASQGALTYDPADNLLLAVNAGSNTISVFSVFGDRLALRQVVGSGGSFPVSVTARRGEVFVLNAENGGSLQGYAVVRGYLLPIGWLHRSLGLATGSTGEPEQFTHTPGQVAFSPDGSKLIVTTKAAGQSVEVFNVYPFGAISQAPVVTPDPTVPFAVAFDPQGHLLLAEAAGALASYQINRDGSLTQLASVATEQTATCWVTPAAGYYYTSNAGSATLTGFRDAFNGQLTLLGNTPTHPGTVDGASAGRDLYVQGGLEGTVDEFSVTPTGGLESIGSLLVPGAAGGEGIATN
jgi:6-phosphogluconolactonase (cycloisomerase 2 family)